MTEQKHTYILIMAGGVGSRFWPASKAQKPKQFLDILGLGKSLLQMTYERFLPLVPAEQIYVLTQDSYTALVLEQLPGLPGDNLVIEPARNNTAPCVAYAAFKINQKDPLANVVVAPADHLIMHEELFHQLVEEALTYTSSHTAILTLGITPSRPETGYGYIEKDAVVDGDKFAICRVGSFREKPDVMTAKKYLENGRYLWNSGIFIFSCRTILEALKVHAPEIFNILEPGIPHYNTAREEQFIRSQYRLTPNISIDYAVMEKADNIYVMEADIGWSDLGTWSALSDQLPADKYGNTAVTGYVHFEDSEKTLVSVSPEKLVVIRGLKNYLVVEDNGVLLIYPKQVEQEIKKTRQFLEEQFPPDYF